MSSESIKSGMFFWLIFLSTFSWACLSVPYWIVKSQHCYTYVTIPLCTFVTAIVGATLFVLLNATFEKLGLALGITLLAALIQTIKKDGFWMKVQRMHDPSENFCQRTVCVWFYGRNKELFEKVAGMNLMQLRKMIIDSYSAQSNIFPYTKILKKSQLYHKIWFKCAIMIHSMKIKWKIVPNEFKRM